jgi:hypothetical protein
MVSYSNSSLFHERYKKRVKRVEQVQQQFFQLACSTFKQDKDQNALKKEFNELYEDTKKIDVFKKNVLGYLLSLKLQTDSKYYESYFNSCWSFRVKKQLDEVDKNFGLFDKKCSHTFNNDDESFVFRVILEAERKKDFEFVRFLLNPGTVDFLGPYYKYDPNNFWREFPKDLDFRCSVRALKKIKETGDCSLGYFQEEWLDYNWIRYPEKIAELLLEYGYIKDISEFKFTVRRIPCGFKYGCDSEEKVIHYKQMSPLHAVCKSNNKPLLTLLLLYMKKNPEKLNINSLDGDGMAPIDYAIQMMDRDDITLASMLIDAGADYVRSPFFFTWFSLQGLLCSERNWFKELTKIKQDIVVLEILDLMLKNRDKKKDDYLYFFVRYIDRGIKLFLEQGSTFKKKNQKREFLVDIAYELFVKWYEAEISSQFCSDFYPIFLQKTMGIDHIEIYLILKNFVLAAFKNNGDFIKFIIMKLLKPQYTGYIEF